MAVCIDIGTGSWLFGPLAKWHPTTYNAFLRYQCFCHWPSIKGSSNLGMTDYREIYRCKVTGPG